MFALVIGQPLYLPTPLAVFSSILGLVPQPLFIKSIGATFLRVVAGFSISFFVGSILGVLAGYSNFLEKLLKPLMSITKATPLMSIIILALVWLNSSHVPIFTCIILCIPIIYSNIVTGVHQINAQFIEMAQMYRVKKRYIFRYIVLPSLKPYIFSGMMITIGFSWKSVVTAEVLSSPKYSIGFNLYATKLYLQTEELFGWTIIIIILSVLLEKLLHTFFDKKVMG
jgi:NitT/TauT family transport system permease protein